MTTVRTAQLTRGPAWEALANHYETVRDLHLRQLFAVDPKRGEHLTAEAAGLYLDYSKIASRMTPSDFSFVWLGKRSSATHRGHVSWRQNQRNRRPGRLACCAACTSISKSSLMGMTSCPMFTPCSIRWLALLSKCDPACGKVTQAGGFTMWSTSVSEVQILDQ